jgi:HPt (histidine-containing phosphotransfer) domain-containing protein
MGIPALREQLLRTFLSDVGPRLDRVAEAIRAGESRRLEFEAHGLKGMAATIGAETCVQVFAELERIGSGDRLDAAEAALGRARAEVDRARKAIEQLSSP